MAASDTLIKIETQYDVAAIKLNAQTPLWPLLRQRIIFEEMKERLGYSNKLRTRNKKQLFFNFFVGFRNLLRLPRFDYLFFNNTDKRVLKDDKYFDIFFDAWADKYGQKRSLFIEWAKEKHYRKKQNYSLNVASDLPLKLLHGIAKKLSRPNIVGSDVLHQIIKENNLGDWVFDEIKSKYAEIQLYKFLFRWSKPKAVFVLSSFTKMPVVMAAKQLKIKVIEAQHGYIGDHHTFYTAQVKFKEAYPDYLLSFGSYEKQQNNPELIFQANQIFPVGSYQLERIKSISISDKLLALKESFDKIFCITLQSISEDQLLDWALAQAKKNPKWLFVIRPKNPENSYNKYLEQANMVLLSENTIYEVLKIAQFNITIYSTTAIEGMFLGAQPIFYNANNLSSNHFNLDKMNAIVINNQERLTLQLLERQINTEHSFFIEGYDKNVKNSDLCF